MNISDIKKIINNWWMILVSGILFIGLGVWIILSPLESYFSISLFFAAAIILAGVMELVFTIENHKQLRGWPWYLAGGIVDIMVGVYLMAYPLVTMVILPFLFGLWMLFRGVAAVGHALRFRDSYWLLLAGIIIILLALLIIANPALGVVNFITWTSLAFFISGVFRVALAFRLRSIQHIS